MDGLARHAKEFVGLYRDFMSRVARGRVDGDGDGEEDKDGMEDRGIGVVRDGAGEGVARDVVSYLERLRDV